MVWELGGRLTERVGFSHGQSHTQERVKGGDCAWEHPGEVQSPARSAVERGSINSTGTPGRRRRSRLRPRRRELGKPLYGPGDDDGFTRRVPLGWTCLSGVWEVRR